MKLEKILLKGERINLRILEERDIDNIAKYANDESVFRYTLHIPFPYTKEHAKEFVKMTQENLRDRSGYELGIEVGSKVVGIMSLINVDSKNKNAEIGYWIGKGFRGKGYTYEAGEMIVRFGFEELGLIRIYGKALAVNEPSIGLMRKLGFKNEGVQRKHRHKNGQWYDVVNQGLLKEDWKQKKASDE